MTIMFILRASDSFAARILSLSADQRKDQFNGKIRGADASYARKMNIITIFTHFCKFTPTQYDVM